MKKIIAIFIVFCLTASLFALEEVRGVQTRVSKYSADGIEESLVRGRCSSNFGDGTSHKIISLAGFELTNENNYPVWVEVELYQRQYENYDKKVVPESVIDTKNITLKAGESYLWKTHILATCQTCKRHGCTDNYELSETQKFFVKYKAYKADTGTK